MTVLLGEIPYVATYTHRYPILGTEKLVCYRSMTILVLPST